MWECQECHPLPHIKIGADGARVGVLSKVRVQPITILVYCRCLQLNERFEMVFQPIFKSSPEVLCPVDYRALSAKDSDIRSAHAVNGQNGS